MVKLHEPVFNIHRLIENIGWSTKQAHMFTMKAINIFHQQKDKVEKLIMLILGNRIGEGW